VLVGPAVGEAHAPDDTPVTPDARGEALEDSAWKIAQRDHTDGVSPDESLAA
jgi:hypothetical protein